MRPTMRGYAAGFALVIVIGIAAWGLSAVAAQEAGPTATGATIDKTGWWNQANPGIDTPAGIQDVPAPANIPEDGIAVSVTAGENDKNAAVGIRPDAGEGDTVDLFTMSVAEVDEPTANANAGADDTIVVACPITEFWTEARNGREGDQPTFDCDAAAVTGERDDEGVWTFDLTPIGEIWLDPFGTIAADGVMLTPGADAGSAFQVVYDVNTIEVTFEFTEGESEEDDPFAVADPPAGSGGPTSGPTGDFGAGSGQVGTFNPPPSPSPGLDDDVASPTPPTTGAPTDEGSTAEPTPTGPISTSRPGLLEDLPGGALFFVLLLVFLALLGAMSYSLGPAGDPSTERVRQGGVSRALASRERSGALDLSTDST